MNDGTNLDDANPIYMTKHGAGVRGGVPGVHIRDPSPTLLMLPHRDSCHGAVRSPV